MVGVCYAPFVGTGESVRDSLVLHFVVYLPNRSQETEKGRES